MLRKETEKLPAGKTRTISDILINAPFEHGRPLLDLDHQQAALTQCVDDEQGSSQMTHLSTWVSCVTVTLKGCIQPVRSVLNFLHDLTCNT